jgi:hypothetical protein
MTSKTEKAPRIVPPNPSHDPQTILSRQECFNLAFGGAQKIGNVLT